MDGGNTWGGHSKREKGGPEPNIGKRYKGNELLYVERGGGLTLNEGNEANQGGLKGKEDWEGDKKERPLRASPFVNQSTRPRRNNGAGGRPKIF